MTGPSVTAVVVVHGPDADRLDACVASLAASTGVELDLVLVDNGSPDAGAVSRSVAARHDAQVPITILDLATNRGFGSGVNAGLRAATGDLIWLLNDDAAVAPDTIERCADLLLGADQDVVAIAPVVHLEGLSAPCGAPVLDSAGLVLRPNGEAFSAGLGQPDLGQYRTGEACLGPCFVAGLFRRAAFEPDAVGPVDERYFLYYEDVDWAVRALRQGRRVLRLAASGVVHGHARTASRLGEGRRYRIVQRNLLVFATLNLAAGRATRIWLQRIVVHAKGIVTGPYRLERVRAVLGALGGLPGAVRDRRSRRERAWVPESELFGHAEGEQPFLQAGTFTVPDPAGAEAAARSRLARLEVTPDP